jgi:predicted negative regulator of RcsB-dependent stress response
MQGKKVKVRIDFMHMCRQYPPQEMTEPIAPDAIPLGEILQGPSKFEEFLEKNKKILLVATLLIAIGILLYNVTNTMRDDEENAAAAALVAAKDIAALESVRTEYADSPAAITAEFLLARKLWESGQQDASISALRELIAKHPNKPVSSMARQSLANSLLAQGKTADAAVVYEEVANDPSSTFLAPHALIALGDIRAKANDKENAKSQYEKVAANYPSSDLKQSAQERIDFLSFELPVEVEPPPPAPPASIALPEAPSAPTIDKSLFDVNAPGSTPSLFSPDSSPPAPEE